MKGMQDSVTYVSSQATMEGNDRAKLYPFGYVVLAQDDQRKPIFIHLLTTSSVLIDNYVRQIPNGEKFFFGEPVLDYPRNASGNASPKVVTK